MKKIFVFISIIFLFIACGPSTDDMADSSKMSSLEEEQPSIPNDQMSKDEKTSKIWKRAEEDINKFELFVGENDKLPLKGSQMMVQVDGFRARVLIDCFYYNYKDWTLEGTFKLRLPNEAIPYYFAFGETVLLNNDKSEIPVLNYKEKKDIELSPDKIKEMRTSAWSNPKEARVVPKEKAALAYSQTVNRRVDPALMEWSGAGIFDCRVFPLQPQKLHRIVVGYDVNLTSINKDKLLEIPLPDNGKPLVVDLDVANISNNIEISPSLNIEKSGKRKRIHIENPDFKSITIRYENLQNCLLISPENSTEKYFASNLNVQLSCKENSDMPENAVLMFDVSLSSNPDKFNVWLKMAEALLKNNQDVIKNFAVLYYNIENHWWQKEFVANNPENISKMLEYCNKMCLIGASDLSIALKEASQGEWLKSIPKNIFLLTDGNITWGESDMYLILNNILKKDKLYCFNTGMAGTDLSSLELLARETGGAVYSVTGEDEVKSASQAFRSVPWKILDIKMEGASDMLIGGRPNYIYSGQNLILAGRGNPSQNAMLELRIEQNGEIKNLKLPFSQLLESDLTKNIYGQIATNQLEEFGFSTDEYSIAYATHYGIPGKTCSFLMLDSEEDYAQYDIKPENNLFIVNNNPVSGIIKMMMAEIKNNLGNPKAMFLNVLKKLCRTPGLTFKIPVAFETLINRMIDKDFSITTAPFICKKHFVSDYSDDISKQLSAHELDYDVIVEEAVKLKKLSVFDELKVLSSLVEKRQGDGVLIRDIAYIAMDNKLYDQAYFLLKYLQQKRPYEPQTYQAIAQCLAKLGKNELAVLYYEIAIQSGWDPRFGEFTYIIALDYIRFIKSLNQNNINAVFLNYIKGRLTDLNKMYENEPCDLMVTIAWNTDFTDIDLHVIEPSDEECFYGHPETNMGGRLTKDVTQGYGPEMYVLKDADKGKYKIFTHYYASNRNRTSAPTKVYATVYQNWGKPNEKVFTKTVILKDDRETNDVLELNIED
jgi:tetratricopeptide (TPR) repeat protein